MAGDYDCPRCGAPMAAHAEGLDCPATRVQLPGRVYTSNSTDGGSNSGGARAPWECPRCGMMNAPHVDACVCAPNPKLPNWHEHIPLPVPPSYPWPPTTTPGVATFPNDCGCPAAGVCMSTACPRRIVVTYSTDAEGTT